MNQHLADLLMKELNGDGVVSGDLSLFAPELVVILGIVFMLLVRLVPRYDKVHLGWIALVIAGGVCALCCNQWYDYTHEGAAQVHSSLVLGKEMFGRMLVFDGFSLFIKIFLYGFTALIILLTLLTGIPDRDDSADFYCLILGATLGMSLMASSNHLLMVFISIEMASLPSYALAGFLKGRRQSSEAALKYVVYGGGASGVMLYGISLLVGIFHTGHLPTIMTAIGESNQAATIFGSSSIMSDPVFVMGMAFLLLGIGFKLASVPFHFWCPDVFEGAAAEVGAFLSVASKGAALALLARIVIGLSRPEIRILDPFPSWSRAADFIVPVLAIFSVITMTFGNLAAYGQTNLKRLLAYSTIAHAGFMMMGLATLTREGAAAVLFYLIVYLFMNLGAFAVVAFLRNLTGQEDLSYFRGFVYRCPLLVIMLGVFLLSLLGLPPLGGFTAKFQIFTALFDGAQVFEKAGKPALSWTLYALLVAGGLNTVVSLFYYVKVLKVMCLEKTLEEVEDRPIEAKPLPIVHGIYVTVLALVVVVLGTYWNPLAVASGTQAVETFRAAPQRFEDRPPGPAPEVMTIQKGPGGKGPGQAPKKKAGGND